MSGSSVGSDKSRSVPSQIEQTVLKDSTVSGNLTIESVQQTTNFYPLPPPRIEPKPFTVPYDQNPHFTGRAEILAQIHATLGQTGTAALSQAKAIHGLGGVGKTQTAVEYAYRYAKDPAFYESGKPVYDWVLWVNASNLTLAASFGSIAADLALPNHETQKLDENTAAVSRWLETHGSWLLIFDNVDEPKAVKPFRPKNPNGRILLTSRSQRFESLGVANPIALNDMTPAEAHEFLLRRTGRSPLAPLQKGGTVGEACAVHIPNGLEVPLFKGDLGGSPPLAADEQQALIALAQALGYLPLALEQAAAYMLAKNVSFAAYLRSYEQRRLQVLEKQRPEMGDYPDSVATTWAINVEAVKASSPAAADLLNLSAFLAPDNIPYELLLLGKAHLGELLSQALANAPEDELVLPELLEELTRYSLIRLETEHRYSIHRLVQEVLRDALKAEEQQWQSRVIEALNQTFPDVEFKNWGQCERLIEQVQAIERQTATQTSELARLLNQTGHFLYEQGRYSEAEPLYLDALNIYRSQLGNEHPSTATSLNNLALLYSAQGRYREAEPLYLDALNIRRNQLGTEHLDTANSLNNLAALYYSQGRDREAEPLLLNALNIRRSQLGDEHPDTATSLNNLAELYRAQGRDREAEPLYLDALNIYRSQLGDEHPSTAQSLNNLALLFYSQGRDREAEPLYLDALNITRSQLGIEHLLTATSLNNLAGLYYSQGRYREAESLYLDALNICRRQLGAEHPHTASSLNNLAALYESQERYSEAEPLYLDALNIRRSQLGAEHPDTGSSLNNLAEFYKFEGRYSEAEPLYLQALAILMEKLGENHPTTQKVRGNFRGLLQQALEAGRAAELSEHPTTRAVLAQIQAEQTG